MNQAVGCSFVIPCYNESPDVIRKTVETLWGTVEGLVPFEIILVNDGSTQGEMPEFTHENVHVLNHDVNQGYGASLMTGILHARYEWIGITDADGTYPIDHFKRFFEFTSRYDMIVGKRNPAGVPFMRRFPKYLLRKLAGFIVAQDVPDLNSGMRLFKKSIALNFRRLFPKRFSFTTTLTMICITNFFKVRFIDIPYYDRVGKSAIQPIRDTIRFFSLVFKMALYYKPLRFFMPLSGVVFLCAVARALRDIIFTNHFGGLTLVLFFMAFQIFFFGLIAEIVSKK